MKMENGGGHWEWKKKH